VGSRQEEGKRRRKKKKRKKKIEENEKKWIKIGKSFQKILGINLGLKEYAKARKLSEHAF